MTRESFSWNQWENFKHSNIIGIRIPKGERKESENILEAIIIKHVIYVKKPMSTDARSSRYSKHKKHKENYDKAHCIQIPLLKKNLIMIVQNKKYIMIKRIKLRMAAYLSLETIHMKRE